MLDNSDEDTIVEYSYKGHGWKIEEYSIYSSRGEQTAEIVTWILRVTRLLICDPTRVMRGRLEQCYVLNTQQKVGIMMIISTLIY